MNYGFIIDNRRCIGCHACSTACKSENNVPLGVNRTWVKYVDSGTFPESRRSFQVTRCNHCENPPCVSICPVTAMYQREDGIVEFDHRQCIGCKACLQACPYDAIYIDPDSGTAAKCHYCAHRTDIGLAPACVITCPTEAIIYGDLDDQDSKISRTLAEEMVTVRKPEQETRPNLFYVDGNYASLNPTVTAHEKSSFLWADHISSNEPVERAEPTFPQPVSAQPASSPGLEMGGRLAEHMVQVSYNAQHHMPWHWPVPAYLVTKGLASGIFLMICLLMALGMIGESSLALPGIAIVLFTGVTTALLVFDLERPERFLKILFRPQWKSWLTKGAFILIGFSLLAGLWLCVELAVANDWLASSYLILIRRTACWLGVPLAVGTAIYTGFLFAQAEGRDLWQSWLLPIHLLVQALMMGCAGLFLLQLLGLSWSDSGLTRLLFIGTLFLDLLIIQAEKISVKQGTDEAKIALHDMMSGRYKSLFWWGSIVTGHLIPICLLLWAAPLTWFAGLASIIGLYCYEHAYVMAPQRVPNS